MGCASTHILLFQIWSRPEIGQIYICLKYTGVDYKESLKLIHDQIYHKIDIFFLIPLNSLCSKAFIYYKDLICNGMVNIFLVPGFLVATFQNADTIKHRNIVRHCFI